MATKKICDRCGAVIPLGDDGKRIVIYGGSYEKQGEADLCVSCHFHLRKWLKGEGEKE